MNINALLFDGEGTDVAEVYTAGKRSSVKLFLEAPHVQSVLISSNCSFF